jgi:hypothetical protein
MSSRQTVIIKNYHNGGGDLSIAVSQSVISEKSDGSSSVVRLKITRRPDKHSTRLGMFAYLRNNQPDYQRLGFSEVTLVFEQFTESGKFLARTFIVFSDVAVEKNEKKGNEEEITFIAAKKSGEFAISNVVGFP